MKTISDLIFFAVLIITVILVAVFAIIGNVPNILTFWWIPLVPVIIIKKGLPNSKITKWLDKERWHLK